MEKAQTGGRVSGQEEEWRVGGGIWREVCPAATVLHSEDLGAEQEQ